MSTTTYPRNSTGPSSDVRDIHTVRITSLDEWRNIQFSGSMSNTRYYTTTPHLETVHFSCFEDFDDLVQHFPNVKDLVVKYCSWGTTSNPRPWNTYSTEPLCRCRCAKPRAPRSLSILEVFIDNSTCPILLAEWLMHSQDINRPFDTVQWTFDLQVDEGSTPYSDIKDRISGSLRILGPSLTKVALIPFCVDKGADIPAYDPPDLSHNKRLHTLELRNIVPGYCPKNFIPKVLSTICKSYDSDLSSINVHFYLDDPNQDIPWNKDDFKALRLAALNSGASLYFNAQVAYVEPTETVNQRAYPNFKNAVESMIGLSRLQNAGLEVTFRGDFEM